MNIDFLKPLKRLIERLRSLQNIANDYETRAFEINQRVAPEVKQKLSTMVNRASGKMTSIAQNTTLQLTDLANAHQISEKKKRIFQVKNRLFRDMKTPDLLNTIIILMLAWSGEGILTAASMVIDGHTDIIVGLGFGFLFSGINIAWGLFTGFFCVRYFNYKIYDEEASSKDKRKRNWARFGLFGSILIFSVLCFFAGRVRVTGSHADVLSFENVSFLATFNDALAVCIMVLAVISYCVALYEGVVGISDPIPDYKDNGGDNGQIIKLQAEELLEGSLIELEDIAEEVTDEIDDTRVDREELAELYNLCLQLKALNDNAKQISELDALSRILEERYIDQDPEISLPKTNLEVFDRPKVKAEDFQLEDFQTDLVQEVDAALLKAVNLLQAQEAKFIASTMTPKVSPPDHLNHA